MLLPVLAGLLMLPMAHSRIDMPHMFPMVFWAWIVSAPLMARLPSARLARGFAAVQVIIFVAVSLFLARAWMFGGFRASHEPAGVPAAGIHVDPQQAAAAAFVRENTPQGSRIFVANSNLLATGLSDFLFYYLAQRQSLRLVSWGFWTNEYELPQVRAELSRRLDDPATSAVVLLRVAGEPGSLPVEGQLRQFGRQVKTFGDYEVRLR
jgi:hypothetical protein